jgi:hypothetical protein
MRARELLEDCRVGAARPPLEVGARLCSCRADLASCDVCACREQRETLGFALPSRHGIHEPSQHLVGMRDELAFELLDAWSGQVSRTGGRLRGRGFGRGALRDVGLGSCLSGERRWRGRWFELFVDCGRRGSSQMHGEKQRCREED